MKVQPIGNRVLIEIVEAEQQTKSGIFIPDSAQEKTQVGTVIAVGDGSEVTVKVGQKVMHDRYTGTSVKMENKDNLIVKMEDIIAIVD